MWLNILHAFLLSFSVCGVRALLPYSIPNIEAEHKYIGASHRHIGRREAIGITSSSLRPTQILSGTSYSSTGTASARVSSSDTHDWRGSVPFPISLSSTISRPGTIASSGAASLSSTSDRLDLTDTTSFPTTNSTSVDFRTIVSSTGLPVPSQSTAVTSLTSLSLSTSTSSDTSATITPSSTVSGLSSLGNTVTSNSSTFGASFGGLDPVVLTTVTASDGSPRVITITVSASTMPNFPFPPGGNPFEPSDQPAQSTLLLPTGLPFGPSDRPAPPVPSGPGGLPANPSDQPVQPGPSAPGGLPSGSSDQPVQPPPTGPEGFLPNPTNRPDQPNPSSEGVPNPPSQGIFPTNPPDTPGQPNPSEPSGNNPGYSRFPPPHIFDVVVDGEIYHLPSPQQSELKIILLDGTFASLFANKVVLRGQTLDIPAGLSASQEISSGGQSVTAQPGEAKEPESDGKEGGGGGGGGIFGALGGLIGAAGSAAGSIADVGTGALGLAGAAGGAAGGVAAGLTGTFGTAASNVGGLVSSLNGIQKAFPLADLAKTGLDSVMNAQNLGRDAANWVQSMGKMVQGFDGLGADEQQQMRNNIQEYAGPGGPLEQAGQAMRAFSDFPWSDQVLPTQSPTGSQPPGATQTQIPTISTQLANTTSLQNSQGLASTRSLIATATGTEASTRTTTSSATSATSNPSEKLVQYFIVTKDGTSLETFNKFVKDLDGGVGEARTYDMKRVNHQNYMTNITTSQAELLLKDHDFILAAIPCVFDPAHMDFKFEYHAVPKAQSETRTLFKTGSHIGVNLSHASSLNTYTKLQPKALIPEQNDAPYWKKMISSQPFGALLPTSEDPDFTADDSGGRGVTIYVLDDGFDLTADDLAADGRSVGHFVVSNARAFPSNFLSDTRVRFPRARILDEDIGINTHGTKMATIAGGKINGIAPNADLFLVKTTGNFNRGPSTEQEEKEEREGTRPIKDSNYVLQPGALEDSLNAVRDHILARLEVNPNAKSVINMSWGVQLDKGGAILEPLFRQFFTWTEENKVTVVLAAGNTASEQLHTKVPQKFGTPTNGIITVGGVKQDGTLYTPTSPEVPGQSGSMTVYAPAVDVVVPGPGNLDTGTSQAAAIVGGLAAYFYSLPGVALIHTPTVPTPDENMKEFIRSHAWTRVPLPLINPLSSLDVVYNLAHGDPAHAQSPCAIHFQKRANDANTVAACSLTSSALLSTLSTSTKSPSATASVSLSQLSGSTVLASATNTAPSSPTSIPTPASEKCRIKVVEFDNKDPNNHDGAVFNVNIYPVGKSSLIDGTAICFLGADADERTGVNVKCPPIGDGALGVFNVRREEGDVLRFIWSEKTWTAADERCKLLADWHESNLRLNENERRSVCLSARSMGVNLRLMK